MALIVRFHGMNLCRFIQTLTETSIAIQNMRGQGYDSSAHDDYKWLEIIGRFEKSKICLGEYFIIVLISMPVWYFVLL